MAKRQAPCQQKQQRSTPREKDQAPAEAPAETPKAKRRRWTAEEDAAIRAAVAANRRTDFDGDTVAGITTRHGRGYANRLKAVAKALDRTYDAVAKRANRIGAKTYARRWTKAEDDRIQQAIEDNWRSHYDNGFSKDADMQPMNHYERDTGNPSFYRHTQEVKTEEDEERFQRDDYESPSLSAKPRKGKPRARNHLFRAAAELDMSIKEVKKRAVKLAYSNKAREKVAKEQQTKANQRQQQERRNETWNPTPEQEAEQIETEQERQRAHEEGETEGDTNQ